jgi:thiol-disulfide isomerase/thioredoxin
MGKASRTKRNGSARERIAAQRAAARRTEIRNRVFLASGAVVVVIAIVVAFVLVKANAKPKSSTGASNGPTGTALTSVVDKVTTVPASTLASVGAGTVTAGPTTVTGPPLTAGGKPEVLYIGAEYCPYCAAQRWAMIVALSRFGTFSGLHTVHSSSRDVYANTPTFTFAGSHYTSKYLSFAPVEETTNVPNGPSSYTPLEKPTAAQQALASKYDSQGSIPFIDFGNKYVEVGNMAGYGPQDLSGKSWSQIAAALSDPSSPIAKAVDGSANYTTAALCKLTNNQPASACTPAVKALEAKL